MNKTVRFLENTWEEVNPLISAAGLKVNDQLLDQSMINSYHNIKTRIL